MTVKDLIAELQDLCEDKEIMAIEPEQGDWSISKIISIDWDEKESAYVISGD